MARPREPLDAQKHALLVEDLLRTEPPGPRRERLLAVRLGFDSTNDLEKVAAAVGRARSTSQQWFDAFRQGGVEALLNDGRANNPGRPDSLTQQTQQALEKGLEEGRWRTVPQMHADLTKEFGITLKLGSLYNRLGKAGARLRVPRPRHQNQNPADAGSFREELCARIQALNLPPQRPVRVWVLDEMRHGLHGFTRRVWGLPGHRPVAAMQQTYQWGYVYGAVSLGLARREFLLAETVDQKHLGHFYRQIGESDPAAVHVLIQDGAGFHLPDGHSGLPDNVRIVTLPPYSPELNPIEGLWDQLKDSLCNRVFESLAEQRDCIASWLQAWWSDPRRVRSLIPNWILDQANASSVILIPVL
jgi:transposase